MKDLSGKPLEIIPAEPCNLVANWRHCRLECSLCRSTVRVKYERYGQMICQKCFADNMHATP